MEGLRSRGNIAEFVQLIVRGEQAYQYTLDLSEYGIRTGCSLAEKGWWSGGMAPYGFDRVTYGVDGKQKYRYVARPDKSVEKRTPKDALVEILPPIRDKGKLRSAYSDKLKTDKVKLAPNREQSKVVAMIFDWFVNDGWGIKKIASRLNKLGITPPRGRFWVKVTVRGILLNPAQAGAIVYGRRSDGKHHDVEYEKLGNRYVPRMKRRDVAVREFVNRPVEKCIVVENCHKGNVDARLWEAAGAKFKVRRDGGSGIRGQGARGSSYLLTGDGLMKCVSCVYRFQGSTDRTSKIRYYLDGGYNAGGTEICSMNLVAAEGHEQAVWAGIKERTIGFFRNKKDLEGEIDRVLKEDGAKVQPPDPRRDELTKKLSDLQRKRSEAEKLSEEFGGEASKRVNRIKKEEDLFAKELASLGAPEPAALSNRERRRLAAKIAGYYEGLEDAFNTGTPEEKKRFVRDFIASIEVDGKKRKVRIAYYEDGDNSPLRVMPPTGSCPYPRPDRPVSYQVIDFPQLPRRPKRGRPRGRKKK